MTYAGRLRSAASDLLAMAAEMEAAAPAPAPAPSPAPEPPAPAPAPEPAPEPPPSPEPLAAALYVTHDDGTGPNHKLWSKQANVAWQSSMGDWIDAAGAMQGDAPFASAVVSALGEIRLPLDDVQRFARGGILLRYSGKSSPYATVAGRLSDTPPVLRVQIAADVVDLPCLSLAAWNSSTLNALVTTASARITPTTNAVAVFDIPPGAESGELVLTVTARSSYVGAVGLFALRPPGVWLPRLSGTPALGLASTVTNEDDLRSNPLVVAAADWSDLRSVKAGGPMWTGIQISDNADAQVIDDPTAPGGGRVLRARFRDRVELAEAAGKSLAWADQNGRGCLSFTREMSPADLSDPMRPPANVVPEAYFRTYVLLEDDWAADNEACKMALGWDMRYGWWNESGYWQQTTGNGGSRGSGLKLFLPANTRPGQKVDQWEYQGHSIRMECGIGPKDRAHPYDALRPLQSYTYSLDQKDFNGVFLRHGNAMIERGRWHCIEQRVRMNSVRPMTEWDHAWEAQQIKDGWLPASRALVAYTDGFDPLGNGGATPDGQLDTWLDGRLIDRRADMRFRRHREMGVGSPWINFFYGGKQASNREQHFRLGRTVLASAYIGPAIT